MATRKLPCLILVLVLLTCRDGNCRKLDRNISIMRGLGEISSEFGADVEADDKWTNNERLIEPQSRAKLFAKVLTPIKATPEFGLSSATGDGRHFERQETYQVRRTIHGRPVKKRTLDTMVGHSHQKDIGLSTERNSGRLGKRCGVDMIKRRRNGAGGDNGRSGVWLRPFRANGRRLVNCTGQRCQGMGYGSNIRRLTLDARLRYMGIGKRLAKRRR